MEKALQTLQKQLEGDLYLDTTLRILYSTDASVYKEVPLAVAIPSTVADLKKLIHFASTHHTSLIPRTAGTSLAGQVVGKGIVVDVSKKFNQILEINKQEKWVRVQPGVNLDELNKVLEKEGLFFGPETSTSNRCMIGGMVGNNSCGSHSIIYGTTRDHVLEMKVLLSDGTETTFGPLSEYEFNEKCLGRTSASDLETVIYMQVRNLFADHTLVAEIKDQFPKPSLRRRNTGYALDEIMDTEPFLKGNTPWLTPLPQGVDDRLGSKKFNFCKLLAGSEGTLALTTEIKLNLVDAPPKTKGALAVHLDSIYNACMATIEARRYDPGAIELLDDFILQNAKKNSEQEKNRFFIQGDPKAVIIVEWARETKEEIERLADALETVLRSKNLGYHFPRLWGAEIGAAWSLRKAGLGLLANIPGDSKAVACIEDTAVDLLDQPEFVKGFEEILRKYNQKSVFYAHIGDGEIHLRPILDLKKEVDRQMFYTITDEVASLVKKHRGSLSGEHGDGRVRGQFISKMVGDRLYGIFKDIKYTWDPNGIFNPGKIVDTPPMYEFLRYSNNQVTREIPTHFDFSDTHGILRMAEKCNGSGDCRKSSIIGGTMCPSFQATRNEKETTRARANILREFLTHSSKPNPFDHKEIKEVYDLCLSCKGCKSECPSNVDVARLKAEFTQHYYDANGVPFRSFMIGHFVKVMEIASYIPHVYNALMSFSVTRSLANRIMGIHPKRHFPLLHTHTLRSWYTKVYLPSTANKEYKKGVYLFADEFTNFNDTPIGIKTILLLDALGYKVTIPEHKESGRTFLSKGFVRKAQKLAKANVALLEPVISSEQPLLGIEPSAILSFRDEYPALVGSELKQKAIDLSKNCMLVEEFLAREIDRGQLRKEQFSTEPKKIKLHGHCHQKALSTVTPTKKLLEFPQNYSVEMIPSGCCGMAGSFGYEQEHYDLSIQVGEMVLFPTVRKATGYDIVAPGTSCRHQILDGTGRAAKHPLEVLYEALHVPQSEKARTP